MYSRGKSTEELGNIGRTDIKQIIRGRLSADNNRICLE